MTRLLLLAESGFFVALWELPQGYLRSRLRTAKQRNPMVEALIALLLKVLWDVVWYIIRRKLERKNDKQS